MSQFIEDARLIVLSHREENKTVVATRIPRHSTQRHALHFVFNRETDGVNTSDIKLYIIIKHNLYGT